MNYISEDFHLHYLPSYTLYVQSNLHRDHILVLGPAKDVLVNLEYDNENPPAEAAKLLSLPFEKAYVSLPHQHLIWVPSEVFEPVDLPLYTDHFLDQNVDRIFYKEIEDQGIVALYQIDAILLGRWKRMFSSAHIFPTFLPVINNAVNNMSAEGEIVGVHIYGSVADIFLFMNNEIRLYNTFEIQTPDDLSYYILSLMKNFGIEGRIPKILLSGASKDSEWGERLSYYCTTLEVLQGTISGQAENPQVRESIAELNILVDLSVCE